MSTSFDRPYYREPYRSTAPARIEALRPAAEINKAWRRGTAIRLDAPLFYPEGGGQPGDRGELKYPALPRETEKEHESGQSALCKISDCVEKEGELWIWAEDAPPWLTEGLEVGQQIDFGLRYRWMQHHTGEHILSGIANRLWGCRNVGFSLSEREMTLDFDRELSEEQLAVLEEKANEVVWADLPLHEEHYESEEAAPQDYRSKKSLEGEIRLVVIGDTDKCACCALHVRRTGEVGSIRILRADRHRGGLRLVVACGRVAWELARREHASLLRIGQRFSVPPEGVEEKVERQLAEQQRLTEERKQLLRSYWELWAGHLEAGATAPVVLADEQLGMPLTTEESRYALNALLDAGVQRCLVLTSQGEGYGFLAAFPTEKLAKAGLAALRSRLELRGGGRDGFLQGQLKASLEAIRRAWAALETGEQSARPRLPEGLRLTLLDHSGLHLETKQAHFVFDYYQDPSGAWTQPGDKPTLVFSSHGHFDHFVPDILDWKFAPGSHYYLSADIFELPAHRERLLKLESEGLVTRVEAHSVLEDAYLSRAGVERAFAGGSTDLGTSFLLDFASDEANPHGSKAPAWSFLHAGDLNDWDWQDADSPAMHEAFLKELQWFLREWGGVAEKAFPTDVPSLEEIVPAYSEAKKATGKVLDLACVPVDLRLKEKSLVGGLEWAAVLPIRALVPIHLCGGEELPEKLQAALPGGETEVISLTHPGRSRIF